MSDARVAALTEISAQTEKLFRILSSPGSDRSKLREVVRVVSYIKAIAETARK